MSDHPETPAVPPEPPAHSAYYTAVGEEDALVREALAHIAAEEDEGNITTREAADERIRLLEQHLGRCRELRIKHLGGTP